MLYGVKNMLGLLKKSLEHDTLYCDAVKSTPKISHILIHP